MTVIDKERLARLARALDNRAKAHVKTEEDKAMIAEAVLDGKINNKQDKTDNTLNTGDKTIVGAINELELKVSDISNGMTEVELDLLLEEIFGINSKNELTSVRLGNYQMKYDNVNDTLDFLYNGVIDEPMEETIPLAWVVGNLSGTDGSETEQSSTLRTGFVTIEDNYDYSFYLDTSMSDPGGIRVYFYDSNKTFISRTDGDTIGYITGSYNSIYMPNNAAYMRFKSNVNDTTTINNINSLFTLRKRKTAIVNNYEALDLDWIVGYSLDGTTGEPVVDAADAITDFILYDKSSEYFLSKDTVQNFRWYFYDSNKTFISRTENRDDASTINSKITFPENTAYFRLKLVCNGLSGSELKSHVSVKKTLSYVNNGLSMYIDADDVASYGSLRDITGKQSITNHGVSTTLNNGCLNFVSTESDYLDTDLVPNLTTWSAELYFYFTETPTSSQTILGWGVSGNKMRIAYSGSNGVLGVQSNNNYFYTIDGASDLISPHHLIITMNNGAMTSYLDGVKNIECTSGDVQTSHTNTLKIGTKYDVSDEFTNMNLKMFRFYDGKVLTDEEALQNYKYETRNNYVTNGLSLYIDARDVATHGSIRDITGKQNITNHGVSTTLDNGCLNFVASESDYIDCGFKPNLTKWSAEFYFYFTATPTQAETVLGWGASGNRTAIAFWGTGFMIAITDNVENTITSTPPTTLTHIVLTYNNNGRIIAYVNGVKSQITTSANTMTSQSGNLMIGTKYSASSEFGNIHLKSLRFYDGKVLTDEEALQNYKYEIKVDGGEVIPVTWIDNRNINYQGVEFDETLAMITDYLTKEDGYNYTINLTSVSSVKIYFFDSSRTFISRTDNLTVDSTDITINFPETCKYFRVKSDKGTVTVSNANDYIIIKKNVTVPVTSSYVKNGLSMYIDANDVATYGSVRDITGKQTVTNHGATLTSDNKYLNFVANESDYLDTSLVPNLSTWSAEFYFHFTTTPTSTQHLASWGVSGNRNRIYFSRSNGFFGIQTSTDTNRSIIDNSNLLKPHHVIITMDNGVLISYLDGIKTKLTNVASVLTSHTGTLKIGAKYDASNEFANINLRMFRFYDGKVLSDEEALQNYNYELNRDVIKPTWKTNTKLDDTGMEITSEHNACSDFIPYDSSYDYTLAIDTVVFFRVFTYDSSKAFISKISIEDNFNGVITPPSNTAYIRLKLGTNNMAVSYSELDNHVVLKKVHK